MHSHIGKSLVSGERGGGWREGSNRSTARGGHSTASQATSLQLPITTMLASSTSQTYLEGILKQKPTSYRMRCLLED